MHLGVIGFGNIGQELFMLLSDLELVRLTVLVRPGRIETAVEKLESLSQTVAARTTFVDDIGAFLAAQPSFVVETAGHDAVLNYGADILKSGTDLVVVSIGALADAALHDTLVAAARKGKARMILPSGAVGGLDILAGLAPAGDMQLRYFGTKPPKAWVGTPVAQNVDLDTLDHVLEFFHGTAREAASAYPKNANVAAALALAGGGFDATQVTLIADPAATGNSHRYELISPLATVSVDIANKASGGNVKTSLATVYSVLREIRNRLGPIAI
ncbi:MULTISPECIES: aspartate dehydrogenase [Pacificibacter]|uniref:aspartate dehydrogenase n=1 Tax=Pacificibacter TaxID=1042323 RepID=UPI001C081075|nr:MULTISPECIES: aspartate dehydrogenase [Pacificibacter]MBU2935201.1 aspartate dehydrogenase [Pacificibacter marinus]MDO6615993.1 aspartate dehydrogenase [Pacificibacter sp. 1_MG-2023]